jgi:hypothetical protein
VFALGISFLGMVSSGVSLYQQLILEERGLPESVFHVVLIVGLFSGMAANIAGGLASRFLSMSALLSIGLAILAASLLALPFLRTPVQAYGQAVVSGVGGGLITVLFFSVWAHAFGPAQVARIQGVAQMLTVLASAVGPLIVAWGRELSGGYLPILSALAAVGAALAAAALFVSVPCAARGDWSDNFMFPNLTEKSAS